MTKKIRNWINQLLSKYDDVATLIAELRSEKDWYSAQRQLMKAEQSTYKREFENMRKEMEYIKTTHHSSTKLSPPTSPPSFKHNFQTKSIKQEDISPIPTFMSTQAQSEEYCKNVNEQNENQNAPIPADTLICYSYGITTVYGHIMDE